MRLEFYVPYLYKLTVAAFFVFSFSLLSVAIFSPYTVYLNTLYAIHVYVSAHDARAAANGRGAHGLDTVMCVAALVWVRIGVKENTDQRVRQTLWMDGGELLTTENSSA